MAKILVVDDEMGIRELLSEILQDEGHDVLQAENATAARQARLQGRPDLVLLDIWMPDSDGISLLKEWAAAGLLTMPVIMMSGHGTIDTAVEATRIGALEFLEKPIALQKLLSAVKRGLVQEQRPKQSQPILNLATFSKSAPLRELRKKIEQMCSVSRTLLLRAGHDSIADLCVRTIKPGSPTLDLSNVTTPLEIQQLERIQGGVLIVSQLSKLSKMQQKNVQFALERLEKFQLHSLLVTDQNSEELLGHGWEAHLVQRLFEVSLSLPTLSELRDELPEMASQIMTTLVESGEVPLRKLDTSALNMLRNHSWPGGFIELRAALKSLALSALEDTITADMVSSTLKIQRQPIQGLPLEMPYREARDEFEKVYFEYHLNQENGNMTRLAERTGLERTHLYRKLKQLGINHKHL